MNVVLSTALMIVILSAIGSAQQTFLHPKLKSKELVIERVYLMPVIVELSKSGVKGNEGMGKEADKATEVFTTIVARALRKAGYKVDTPFAEDRIRDNNELKYAVSEVQQKYDQVSPQLMKRSQDIRKGRFTLGDTVARVNPKGEADALVLVRSKGTMLTKGKAALMGGAALGRAMAGVKITYVSEVSLVDAKTGDVVSLSKLISVNGPYEKSLNEAFAKTKGR